MVPRTRSRDGIPDNAAAWLNTAAGNKALSRLRREHTPLPPTPPGGGGGLTEEGAGDVADLYTVGHHGARRNTARMFGRASRPKNDRPRTVGPKTSRGNPCAVGPSGGWRLHTPCRRTTRSHRDRLPIAPQARRQSYQVSVLPIEFWARFDEFLRVADTCALIAPGCIGRGPTEQACSHFLQPVRVPAILEQQVGPREACHGQEARLVPVLMRRSP